MVLPKDKEYEAYSLQMVTNTMKIYSRTDQVSITLYMSVLFGLDRQSVNIFEYLTLEARNQPWVMSLRDLLANMCYWFSMSHLLV